METRLDNATAIPATSPAPVDDGPSISLEQAKRPREEMNMLLMGFGTGISVGIFFLVYIILASTSLAH